MKKAIEKVIGQMQDKIEKDVASLKEQHRVEAK